MKLLSVFLLALMTSVSFAQSVPTLDTLILEHNGGGTSGGGNSKGISAKTVLNAVRDSMLEAGSFLYSKEILRKLIDISPSIHVIMTDQEIKVPVGDYVQDSDAFSAEYQGSFYIYINTKRWESIEDPLLLEELIHHELMVLLGVEETGNYYVTKKFKSFRSEYWKYIQTKNNVCSIQVFEKQKAPYASAPGKLLGSSSSSMTYNGAKGDMGILAKLSKNEVLIWRGVVDSVGYFRMQIERAELYKKSEMVNLATAKEIEPMKVYSDPYSHLGLQASPVVEGNNYWIMVNCNRF